MTILAPTAITLSDLQANGISTPATITIKNASPTGTVTYGSNGAILSGALTAGILNPTGTVNMLGSISATGANVFVTAGSTGSGIRMTSSSTINTSGGSGMIN